MDKIIGWLTTLFIWVVSVVERLGYLGVVLGMMLESSFIPFPSEVVIPPAGYLTVEGDMNIVIVILCGVFGSVLGASINYWIGYHYGRRFLERFGKYMFLNEQRLSMIDGYFARHGEITTLVGRMIPVVRQYISFPAGVARMNYPKFALYTALGASIWVIILAFLGRIVGNNKELLKANIHTVTYVSFIAIVLVIAGYVVIKKRITKRYKEELQ